MTSKIILILFIFNSSISLAKDLYVNTATGNDATTYANNSAASPWKTIGRASWGSTNYSATNINEAAKAGDTVLISAGVYWEGGRVGPVDSESRWAVALNPVNNGTAANPIIFRGIGEVYIRLNNGVRGPMIGAEHRSYIIWDHFIIDDTYGGSVSDTGPVAFVDSDHGQLINSEVMGHNGSYYWGYRFTEPEIPLLTSNGVTVTSTSNARTVLDVGNNIEVNGQRYIVASFVNDSTFTLTTTPTPAWAGVPFTITGYGANYSLIRLDHAAFTTVSNNRIHRVHRAGKSEGGQNEACLMTYDSDDNIVEHNEFFDCGVGIFFKGVHGTNQQARNIIRFNYVHDNHWGGIRVLYGLQSKVYQNIVTNTYGDNGQIGFGILMGFASAESSRVVNNTLYNNQYGNLVPQYNTLIDVHFKNNILMNGPRSIQGFGTSVGQSVVFDRNLYFGSPIFCNYEGAPNISFTEWRAAPYNQDANSINGANPLFVNASGADFHLQGGSPALSLGRVVEGIGGSNGATIAAGAYIIGTEIIGPIPGTVPVRVSPRAPANLRISL